MPTLKARPTKAASTSMVVMPMPDGELDLDLVDDGVEVGDYVVELTRVVGQEGPEVVREVAQLGDRRVEHAGVLGEGLGDQHQVVEHGANLGVAVVDGAGDDVHVV